MLRIACLLTLCLCWLAGCNQTFRLYEFTLKGKVALKKGTKGSGKVFVELYHKETGVGNLSQPLLFVKSFTVDNLGDFSETIEFPVVEERSGLIVYAWQDQDGDGSLCSLSKRDELSGLAEVSGFPKRTVNVTLTLEHACLGPEALYPP